MRKNMTNSSSGGKERSIYKMPEDNKCKTDMRLHSDYELINMILADAMIRNVDVKIIYAIRELEERILERCHDRSGQDEPKRQDPAQKNARPEPEISILKGRIQAYRDVIRMLKDK